jgi:hypothetical protein
MDKITSGNIEMTWEAKNRLAVLRFKSETPATGKDARLLVDAFKSWIGKEGKPFALLGDGDKLTSLDAEYRSIWAAFLRQHRGDCSIAFFNMNPLIRVAADMFRLGAGLNIRAFGQGQEEQARAWLRDQGIGA